VAQSPDWIRPDGAYGLAAHWAVLFQFLDFQYGSHEIIIQPQGDAATNNKSRS